MTSKPRATDTCPRCGGAFHCGARDLAPCACTGLQLGAETLAGLRQRYEGCLCLACLSQLAQLAQLASPSVASPGDPTESVPTTDRFPAPLRRA